MDEAFLVGKRITVDRSTSSKKVTMYLGKNKYATGQVDETYLLTHTGFMKFPDERNKQYPFWYYPVEGILKWSQEKGKGWAGDIWTAESDEKGRNSFIRYDRKVIRNIWSAEGGTKEPHGVHRENNSFTCFVPAMKKKTHKKTNLRLTI